MSMKQRGKSLEQKVVRGSKTVGRDIKRAGKSVGRATRHGVERVESRMKAHRAAKSSRA